MASKVKKTRTKIVPITRTTSTTLVKKLLRTAISSIAFIRALFPEDCFRKETLDSIGYPHLVGYKNVEAKHFVDWLEKGVFDALKRGYLEVVLLEIYNDCGRQLLECFCFTVNYERGGARLQLNGGVRSSSERRKAWEDIYGNARNVLKSLVEMTYALQPLPPSRMLSMKLLYNSKAPANYEPPLFTKASPDIFSWFGEEMLTGRVGSISTPYHNLNMKLFANESFQDRSSFNDVRSINLSDGFNFCNDHIEQDTKAETENIEEHVMDLEENEAVSSDGDFEERTNQTTKSANNGREAIKLKSRTCGKRKDRAWVHDVVLDGKKPRKGSMTEKNLRSKASANHKTARR